MTTNTMYLVIQPRNEEEITRELNEDELLDCDIYAAEYADNMAQYADDVGYSLDQADGYIPDGSGDFRIELLPDLNNRSHVWSAREYFWRVE